VEVYLPDDTILQVIKAFVILEIYMETLLDAHLHFHRDHFFGLFDGLVRQKDGEVDLFAYCGFVVSVDRRPDEVSYSSGDPVEGLVLFLEIGELELPTLGLG
jgi:hypothetical protein